MSSGRGLSALVLGLLLITSPVLFNQVPYSFLYPFKAKVAMMLTGGLLVISSFFIRQADSYGSLLDVYSVVSGLLFFVGPVTAYPVGMDFWMTMSYLNGIFFGFPAAMLLHLNSKDN